VHIKEVPEDQKAGPPQGFVCLDPDEISQGDQPFVCFIGQGLEGVRATQTISHKLAEAAGEACSTCFEDIVPKPYMEFKTSSPRNPSMNSLFGPVEQKQLEDFLDENLKSQCISEVTDGIPSLHQKEGWESLPPPELSKAQ